MSHSAPDGRVLATAANDKTVRLWDVATRSARGEPLTGHTSVVRDVAFSPDGTTLASVGDDKTLRLWDVQSRSATTTFAASTGLAGVAFVPGGLVTGGVMGNVLRWTKNVEQAAAYVCAATKADLIDEEWHRHIPSWPNQRLCP